MNLSGLILSLLAFSILILFHELGHFLLAKLNGVYVEEFSLGMGPTIFGVQGKETKYSLKLLPFGGACMMRGEDENNDDPRAFGSKNVWQRISILFAGPFFNFVLAFIMSVIVLGTCGLDMPTLSGVIEGFPAQAAGMEAGDTIVKLNDEPIHFYRDVSLYLQLHQGQTLDVVYERDGVAYETTIEPMYSSEYQSYMMGIQVSGLREKAGALKTVQYSFYEVSYWIRYVFTSLKMLFVTKEVSVSEVSGPVGMVSAMTTMVEESSEDGFFYVIINLMSICILLSANLGVMNLLPIPALDGGRLLFCLIELVFRKPVKQEFEAAVHLVGIIALLALSFVIMFKDIFTLMK